MHNRDTLGNWAYKIKIIDYLLKVQNKNQIFFFLHLEYLLKVDWDCLRRAAEQLGHLDDLPLTVPENHENQQEFLKQAHHALLEIELINGSLVCPETSRKFPVTDGIPNMLLNEDEI